MKQFLILLFITFLISIPSRAQQTLTKDQLIEFITNEKDKLIEAECDLITQLNTLEANLIIKKKAIKISSIQSVDRLTQNDITQLHAAIEALKKDQNYNIPYTASKNAQYIFNLIKEKAKDLEFNTGFSHSNLTLWKPVTINFLTKAQALLSVFVIQ